MKSTHHHGWLSMVVSAVIVMSLSGSRPRAVAQAGGCAGFPNLVSIELLQRSVAVQLNCTDLDLA
jgi:hypothetical protein